jgi:transcriptional regulator with XRE-family HTH domain
MERLRMLREAKKITQLRLGMELGVSQETISGYEIGKAVPPADMLIKLADTLNTSIDYLLGRTDIKEFKPLKKSDLTEKECELFELFRTLSEEKKERSIGLMMGLKE